ncbi:MAG TPA: acetylglutamate kinase [Terriglobales bacterium]|nr:acetylglutamate kinase [Terriglobales bacterium]
MRVVVKIGGAALDNRELVHKCARAIVDLADGNHHQVAVVHGGGTELTRTLHQLGKESSFVNGLRVADSETRDVALMVLAGKVNKALVAEIAALGKPAIGMCGADGSSFRARKKKTNGCDLGYVGEICAVDSRWIEAIWNAGGIPVISSVALGTDGQYYNVNADQTAAACAVACRAHALIFPTDVAGVKSADGSVIRWLQMKQIDDLVKTSVVNGGMLPKLEACQEALRRGVGRVRILPASEADLLPDFYTCKIDCGTEVMVA